MLSYCLRRPLRQSLVLNSKLKLPSLHNSKRSNVRGFSSHSQQAGKPKRQIPIVRPISITAGGVVALVLGGSIAARLLYKGLLDQQDAAHNADNKGPRIDASKATVILKMPPKVTADKTIPKAVVSAALGADEDLGCWEVDSKRFDRFLAEQRTLMRLAQQNCHQATREALKRELDDALSDASSRGVKSFADWYFAYRTTYRLCSIAMASAAKHAVTFRTQQTLSEAVSNDLQEYVCQKYEAMVLRPAVTNPKIHRAFLRCLYSAHDHYLAALQELDDSVSAFVASQAKPYAHSRRPLPNEVLVEVDWSAQLQKVEHIPLAYEKSPDFSVALIGASAAAGKMVAGGAGVTASSKAVLAKLSSPFAAKAAGTTLGKGVGAGTVSGAIRGAIVGGPLGSAVGAAAGAVLGLGLDAGINLGVELVQRPDFEADILESVNGAKIEWQDRLLPELERVQDVWFENVDGMLLSGYNDEDEGNHNAVTN